MNLRQLEELNRRAFLLRSAISLGGFAPLVKVFPATALMALQTKPVLSEASLGDYIQTVRSHGELAVSALVTAVRSDLRAFLRNRFTLTSVQDAFISRFTTTDLTSIGTAFERGLVGLNELRIRMPEPGTVAFNGCQMKVGRSTRQLVSGAVIESWSVVVVNQ